MKTLIIFDLKETLVTSNKKLKVKQNYIKELATKADLMLYSIAEPWTYSVLSKFQNLFDGFKEIFLVRQKRIRDLESYRPLYEKIIVIGDDENAEIAFAITLGYDSLLARPITSLEDEVNVKLKESKL